MGVPEVVYSPMLPVPGAVPSSTTNKFPPDTAMPAGRVSPETNDAFTVAPEVVYSPTVPVPEMKPPLVTKIWPWAGIANSAADADKQKRINRMFIRKSLPIVRSADVASPSGRR